jgi:hypothetical protein
MIMTLIAPLAVVTMGVGVTCYAVVKGIDYMYQTAIDKEKPITVIKFREWSVGK